MADLSNKLKIIFGDVTIAVKGEEFDYIFSYQAGGMESMKVRNKQWLFRSPRPTFWRALTDNDKGSNFHLKSGMWLASDMFIEYLETKVEIDGKEIKLPFYPENRKYKDVENANNIKLTFTYQTIGIIKTKVDISYNVRENGDIEVSLHYHANDKLPELPVFGFKMIMPTIATRYVYEGLSGETYPDRYKGAKKGIFEVQGLPMTPYIRPQDCGVHINTKNLEIFRNTTLNNADNNTEEFSIKIEKDKEDFAFSLLPYTASEIENAYHHEELPPARRTVLCVYAKVRGVGGIDTWGSDVEEKYHINANEDIKFSFKISVQQ